MTVPAFPYKTPPFAAYQRDILRASAYAPYWFYQMEQGTGKTWVTLNCAAALWLKGRIDGMVVLAPKGVHAAWGWEQIPEHLPDVVPARVHVWQSGDELADLRQAVKQKTVRVNSKLSPNIRDLLTAPTDGAPFFPILCMNSEAAGSVRGAQKAVELMLRTRRCLLVADEASDFSVPSSKRTRALLRWRRLAPYRRALDGTPSGGIPWDVWAPYRFLHSGVTGFDTYQAMKDYHADWVQLERGDNGRKFKVVKMVRGQKQFKHVAQLHEKLSVCTSRITKAVALPFLPAKLFNKRFFELTPEQRRLTRELTQELRTVTHDGRTVTATNILTNYLRRQQVACGYVPTDLTWLQLEDGEYPLDVADPLAILPGDNPRLELCLEELHRIQPQCNPTILWTRFHFDIDLLLPRLLEAGYRVGVYDGRTPTATRERVKLAFQQRELDIFLGNPAAGGRGLNLFQATRVLYYANYFGLRRRLQSEDRAHRIGTTENVLYTDLVGKGSIDQRILSTLRANKDIADLITGDPRLENWL